MNAILKQALHYLEAGLCVIPLRPKDKRPLISWKEFESRMPTEDELYAWFDDHPDRNIGIVCGEISGNLVAVDIDGPEGLTWARANTPMSTVYTKTPKNEFTYHGFYRGKGIRNGKPHPQVDIRGNGGYVVAAPSTHPNGGQYELVIMEGSEGWANLPALTFTQIGLDLSGVKTAPVTEPKTEGSRNQTLAQLVGKWCARGNDLEDIMILAEGWNARNTPPLPATEVFTTVKSIVNAHNRNHPGSQVEAADNDLPEVDLDDQVECEIPAKALQPGGLLQRIMDYTDKASVASVPTFALAGAIALVGSVCGQRIMTDSGLRTNMYVVSIGYSGAGKNAACSAIPQLLLHGARDAAGPTELASAASLWRWLEKKPVTLVCADEIGMILKGLRYPESPKADLPKDLTAFFSSADRPNIKTYSDPKMNITLHYHCLSLYGASTPNEFWKGLSMDDAASGFLARLLVFESRNKAPKPKRSIDAKVPADLAEQIAALWNIKPPNDPVKGNVVPVPVPFVVPVSEEAKWSWEPWCDKWHELRNDNISDSIKASVYGRAVEHAWKLALIHAASSQGPAITNGGTIGTDSIEWATTLVEWLIERLIAMTTEAMSSNDWHATQKQVLTIIRKIATPARPGAAARELKKQIHMHPRMFDDVMMSLEQSGKIHRRPYKSDRGPEGIIFCISKDSKR